MTPELLKVLFDTNAVMIMFVVGLLWKYVPALKMLSNQIIPWLNAALYILVRIFTPADANAAIDVHGLLGGVGIVIGAVTNPLWSALVYDKFAKPIIERILGVVVDEEGTPVRGKKKSRSSK